MSMHSPPGMLVSPLSDLPVNRRHKASMGPTGRFGAFADDVVTGISTSAAVRWELQERRARL
jgi:hypothetical protein